MAISNRHDGLLDIVAPGTLIEVADIPSTYQEDGGTSLATPHVTAAVALAQHIKQGLQGGGRLTREELEALFKSTGKQIFDGDENMDNVQDPGEEEKTYTTPTQKYYKRLDVEAMAYKLFKPATAPDLVFASDWGFEETDEITGDTTPTFTGTAPVGSHVWLYVDGMKVADGPANASGVYTLTASTLPTGVNKSVTIRVAADSSVPFANQSEASVPLLISIVESDAEMAVNPSFTVRMSETLVVSGANSGTSSLTAGWTTAVPRSLTKAGTGTITFGASAINDRTVSVVYNADGGKTIFNVNTGTANSFTASEWSIHANAEVEFTTSQNLAALVVEGGGLVKMTQATPPNYKLLYVESLDFVEDASGHAIGTLDLTNNGMVIEFTTDAQARAFEPSLRGWLLDGRGSTQVGSGTWDGTGITSSTATSWNMSFSEGRSIGYAVNADFAQLVHIVYTVFLGQSVDSSAILIRYTATGDTDLDGDVDDDDVTVFNVFYEPGASKPHWVWGDLNFDGVIDDEDATLFGVMLGEYLET
jgi:hypothetical protein